MVVVGKQLAAAGDVLLRDPQITPRYLLLVCGRLQTAAGFILLQVQYRNVVYLDCRLWWTTDFCW